MLKNSLKIIKNLVQNPLNMITETSFPRGGAVPKKEPEEKIVSTIKETFFFNFFKNVQIFTKF